MQNLQYKFDCNWVTVLQYDLLRLRKTQSALQLHMFFFSSFFSFFCQPYPELWEYKSVFLILEISQYGGSRRWVHIFPRYPWKKWFKNWYLDFYKAYDQQTWQDGGLPCSRNSLIMLSYKITWQPKSIISSLPQCL